MQHRSVIIHNMKDKIFGVFLCASLLLVNILHAETKSVDGYTLRLKAAKEGAVYSVGDTAEFVFTSIKGGKPENIEIEGDITKDGLQPPLEKFEGKTVDGTFSTVRKLAEPGVLRCRVLAKLPGGKKVELLAGAAFDPKKIAPSMEIPKDFSKYWSDQRKILDGIALNAEMKPVKCGKPNVELFDIKADSFNGFLRGYYARPKGAKPKSCPAIILPHGAGVRSSGIAGAIKWAEKGFIALDFNAHGIENGKPKEFYDNLSKTSLKGYPHFGKKSRDTSFFRTLFMRDMRAMDFMMAQPEWDGKIFVTYGTSQGGGQSIASAALNPKVTFCVAFVPAMCDHSALSVGRMHGWPRLAPSKDDPDYNAIVEAARYMDAMNFASLVKCDTYFNVDLADDVCAPTSCFAAFNNIKGRKHVNVVEESRHRVPSDAYFKGDEAVMNHIRQMRAEKPKEN